MKHTNLPARILTRGHQNMNLLAHITCSPPAMNLPAHDINKHLQVQVSHHIIQTQVGMLDAFNAIAWRCLSATKRYSCADCLAKRSHRQAPGCIQTHCSRGYRLAGYTFPPGATCSKNIPNSPIACGPAPCRQALYQ